MPTTINGDNVTVPGKVTTVDLKVTGGTPGAGKVLTSDADGDATWSFPVGGGLSGGLHSIGSGVDTETITGLGLAFVPTSAILTMHVPSGGLVIKAVVVDGTLTADGFTFYLDGLTDSANYKLTYLLF